MSEQEIYEKFISWLGKTWWELPDSEQLMPIIKARYTVEEAEFLTGMPFSGSNLEELAQLSSAGKGIMHRVRSLRSQMPHRFADPGTQTGNCRSARKYT